jgi:tetratricopeptide (TPR) repeat protein
MFRLLLIFALSVFAAPLLAQSDTPASLLVKAEAGTIVWVDNLRYGAVPDGGELTINNLQAGAHKLRARLLGKRELTQTVVIKADRTTTVQLTFKLPARPAEQSFQQAEALREKGKHKDAIPEYQTALKLNKGSSAPARIGLARSLMATSEYEAAVNEARRAIREAAANSMLAAEATTVIANTYRAQGLYDEAFENYRKTLTLARNVSPEAHTGLALTYQEENNSAAAIQHFRTAAAQANDTEPIIYYLLGNLLDREGHIKDAIASYEKFLLLEPTSKYAVTVRSMLKQLKREAR